MSQTGFTAGDIVRIYVGAMAHQTIAVRLLEFSIRRYASMPLQVIALDRAMAAADLAAPAPAPALVDPILRARTPFSFQRFAIPERCGYAGRALYLGSDMLVFADIAALWRTAMPVPVLAAKPRSMRLRRPQLSVMLLDCARIDWRTSDLVGGLDAGDLDYRSAPWSTQCG